MDLKTIYLLILFVSAASTDLLKPQKEKKSDRKPPCDICKALVKSFNTGIEKTSRGNFAGGDTAWEEEKLGSYYRSEVRLVEIQEQLCSDDSEIEAQCHSMAEDAEPHLEDWWFKRQDTHPDLQTWLCVSILKICCEPGHYGSDCQKCRGYPDSICSGKGKCRGSGTRTGDGRCICDVGYSGQTCEQCAENYFDVNVNGKLLCSPCHKSCLSGCYNGTEKGCEKCKPGWRMDTVNGCMDINECTSKSACKYNEECINLEGSYKCQEYHGTKDPGRWARYMTYVTFFIATVIFLRINVWIGGFVGLTAAIYVSTSEIIMNNFIDVSSLDFGRFFKVT